VNTQSEPASIKAGVNRETGHFPRAEAVAAALLAFFILAFVAATFCRNWFRFQEFRSVWPPDLAYFLNWFHVAAGGGGDIAFSSLGVLGIEGPDWLTVTHFSPFRFLLIPIFKLAPHPATLLLLQALCVGLGAIPLYRIALRWVGRDSLASGHSARALTIALATTLSYLALPITWEAASADFRILTFAAPAILFAADAMMERARLRFAVTALIALSCRPEVTVIMAFIGFLPGPVGENIKKTIKWAVIPILLSAGWMLLAATYRNLTFGMPWAVAIMPGGPAQLSSTFPAAENLTAMLLVAGPLPLLILSSPRLILLCLPWLAVCFLRGTFINAMQGHAFQHLAPLAGVLPISVAALAARLDRKMADSIGAASRGRATRTGIVLAWGVTGLLIALSMMRLATEPASASDPAEKKELRNYLAGIPVGVSVVVDNRLSPHVALRDSVANYEILPASMFSGKGLNNRWPDNVDPASPTRNMTRLPNNLEFLADEVFPVTDVAVVNVGDTGVLDIVKKTPGMRLDLKTVHYEAWVRASADRPRSP